jgi:hypothetical protein
MYFPLDIESPLNLHSIKQREGQELQRDASTGDRREELRVDDRACSTDAEFAVAEVVLTGVDEIADAVGDEAGQAFGGLNNDHRWIATIEASTEVQDRSEVEDGEAGAFHFCVACQVG